MAFSDDYAIIGAAADNFDCDSITGWTATGSASAPVLNTTAGNRIEGTGCIDIEFGTGAAGLYHNVSSGSRFKITDEDLQVWFYYVKGKSANYLSQTSDAIYFRLYFGGTTNFADYYLTETGDLELKFGWQVLQAAGTNTRGGSTNFANVNATATSNGTKYRILTPGNTDWTAIGAADSNAGTEFTATGAGTGTGVAINLDSSTWTSDIHRVELRFNVATANTGNNDVPLRMDCFFSGTTITVSEGTPAAPIALSDIQDYSDTDRTAFPLGLIQVDDVFANIRCGLQIGNGLDGTNNEGNLEITEKFVLMNQASEPVKHNITVKNFSSLIIGEKETGTDGDYAVRGCQIVYPPNKYSDIAVENGGILRAYNTKFYRVRYLYLGASSDSSSTVELRKVDIDSCETAYFRANTLDMEDIQIYNNAQEVNDHCGEITIAPDSNKNMLIHDCREGIHFRATIDFNEYIAQDNITYDLGILEGSTASLINSTFDETKIKRVT